MKLKLSLLAFGFLCITSRSVSQTTFELPDNIQLKNREDYAKYNEDIIKAAKWLEETDMDKEIEKRKLVGKFVMEWMLGTPDVSISLNEPLTKLFEDNPSFMGLYFANAAKYVLENKNTRDNLNTVKAGLTAMINVYEKKISIKRSKAMDKLISAKNKNKLDEYIAEKILSEK